MAFSLSHSIVPDTTTTTTQRDSAITALNYLRDTFLPGLPGSGSTTVSSKSGYQTVIKNIYDSGNNYIVSNWHNNPSTGTTGDVQLTLNEDATYSSTIGDTLSDTTNSVVWQWYDESDTNASKTWRFWVSSVEPDAWFVTQGSRMAAFWLVPHFPVEPDLSGTATTTDKRTHHAFIGTPGGWYNGNWPRLTNTTSTEDTYCTIMPNNGTAPDAEALHTSWSLLQSSSNASMPGYVANTDTPLYMPGRSLRSSGTTTTAQLVNGTTSSAAMSTFLNKVLVNGTDWYIFSGAPGTSRAAVTFSMGTSEPDLS